METYEKQKIVANYACCCSTTMVTSKKNKKNKWNSKNLFQLDLDKP